MAWWLLYLLRPEPDRAARCQKMFGNMHWLLPATQDRAHPAAWATLSTLILLAGA